MRLQLALLSIFGLSVPAMSAIASCTSETGLADVADPSLTLFVPEPPGDVVVAVFPRFEKAKELEGPCKLKAPNARATLNGVSLKRRRGKSMGDDLMYDRDCIVEFAVGVDAIPKTNTGTSLKVSDDTATWVLAIPTAFEPRSFTLVAPADGVIRRGKRVVLRWSPSSDRIDGTSVGFELYRADRQPGTGTAIRNIDVRGEHLSFTARHAGEVAWSGRALLRFLGTYHVKPVLGPCPVQSCLITIQFAVPSLAVTVEN